MKKLFPMMLDAPSKYAIVGGVAYGMLFGLIVPFGFMMIFAGSANNLKVNVWFDILYHCVNGLAALAIFGGYLKDSWLNVKYNPKGFFSTVAVSVGFMFAVASVVYWVGAFSPWEVMRTAAYATLPLAENDAMLFASSLSYYSPVWGTLCMVLLVPFATCCLYYGVGFAPVCVERPWLAYLVVAIVVAVPRVYNALTFWSPAEELVMYLVQLPMHLICCWAYQKTDTIWTPIAAQMAVNLIACLINLLLF